MKKLFYLLLVLYLIKIISKGKIKNVKDLNPMFTEADAKEAILNVEKQFGKEIARKVEKIFRLETSHFKSLQYKLTGTAGMEAGKWKDLPKDLKITTAIDDKLKEGQQQFLVWNPKDFAVYVANYIIRHNGNENRWNAIDVNLQNQYAQKLAGIKNRFV